MDTVFSRTLTSTPRLFRRSYVIATDERVLLGILAGISLLVAGTFVATGGNLVVVSAVVFAIAIIFLSFYRVDCAFFVFIGMVLLFDQFIVVPFGDPLTDSVRYFDNLKQNPILPTFSAGVMNPLEIQLALMLFGMFLSISTRKSITVQSVPSWGLAVLFLLALMYSLAYGLGSNGDFLPALWEIRALFYFLLLYFLVPQIIQTKEQINILLWIIISVIAVKDFQGATRYAQLGFQFNGNLCLTNHEDPVFTTDLFVLLIGWAVLGVRSRQRTFMVLLLPILLVGFYAGQRRAAYAGFLACIVVLVIIMKQHDRRKFLRILVPCLIFAGCYTAVFWNSDGRLGSPVQMLKSGFFEDKEDDGSHYTSNLYRKFERYDLASTVQNSPIFGTGFGKKYDQPIPLVPIPFPLRDWIPHDEILWLVVKTGGVGFFVFCLFIDGLLFEASSISAGLSDPFLQALCFFVGAAIVNQLVVSYFDLQLTFYRNMIFLGTLCGLLPTIRLLGQKHDDQPPTQVVQTGPAA